MSSERRDLLVNYGPYGLPNMLLKNVEPLNLLLTAYDGTQFTVRTDIRHSGVKIVGLTTAGFNTIKKWIQDGANKNNAVSRRSLPTRDDVLRELPQRSRFPAQRRPDHARFSDLQDQRAAHRGRQLRGRQLPRLPQQLASLRLRHQQERQHRRSGSLELLCSKRSTSPPRPARLGIERDFEAPSRSRRPEGRTTRAAPSSRTNRTRVTPRWSPGRPSTGPTRTPPGRRGFSSSRSACSRCWSRRGA